MTIDGHSGVGRLARRFVVVLTRTGVSVCGAQELLVKDKNSGHVIRTLVFPVTIDGVEYVVSTRPEAAWVKSLRAAHTGELRCGRRQRIVRTARVDDAHAVSAHEAFQRDVPSLLSLEPRSGPAVAFAVEATPT